MNQNQSIDLLCQAASSLQDACNLRGVIAQFNKTIDKLVSLGFSHMDAVNHKATKAVLFKIVDLTFTSNNVDYQANHPILNDLDNRTNLVELSNDFWTLACELGKVDRDYQYDPVIRTIVQHFMKITNYSDTNAYEALLACQN